MLVLGTRAGELLAAGKALWVGVPGLGEPTLCTGVQGPGEYECVGVPGLGEPGKGGLSNPGKKTLWLGEEEGERWGLVCKSHSSSSLLRLKRFFSLDSFSTCSCRLAFSSESCLWWVSHTHSQWCSHFISQLSAIWLLNKRKFQPSELPV